MTADATREQRVNELIAAHLQAADEGRAPDRGELLARHPDLADELRAFFADHDAAQLVPPPAGTHLRYFGDYELLEEIARGGMGVVYRARQVSLNRVVALKMILARELASEDDVQRFQAEARLAAALQHPGIVAIHEVGEHQGQHYFSMDYVEGRSLADVIRDSPLSAAEAARIVKVVVEAIAYAHGQGVLHRDLKPSNILLDRQGQPRVTDFGLARKIDGGQSLTATGAVLGTPSYMPPEQASGDRGKVGPASDVYSLGAVLYECLTGRPPYRAATPLDTLLQVLSTDAAAPSVLNPGVDRNLETITLKCLEKDSGRRYASAEALADELGRWLRGEPIVARPAGSVEKLWRWCRRNPTVAVLTTAVALLLVGGTVVTMALAVAARSESRRADERSEELARLLYQSNISLAHRDYAAGQMAHGRQVLRECPAALRGWEWHYLRRLCHAERLTLAAGEVSARAVAFSPDGKRIAAGHSPRYFEGEAGKRITVWDSATGAELLGVQHDDVIDSLAFSPDGKSLACGGFFGTVTLWDAATGRLRHTCAGHTKAVCGVAFTPDGKRVASCGDRTVRVWDVATGVLQHTVKVSERDLERVAWSSDGRALVGFGTYSPVARLWDVATGREIRALPINAPAAIQSIAYHPDGSAVALGRTDGVLQCLSTATGREIFSIPVHPGNVSGVGRDWTDARPGDVWAVGRDVIMDLAYSPDGTRLLSGSGDGTVRLWGAASGRPLLTCRGHDSEVNAVAFAPDGSQLLSGGSDGTVRSWDAAALPESSVVVSHDTSASMGLATFSPDGGSIAALESGKGLVLRDALGQVVWRIAAPVSSDCVPTFSPDGTRIAAGLSAGVGIWDTATGEQRLILPEPDRLTTCVAFSPDGVRLAYSAGGEIRVREVSTGREVMTIEPEGVGRPQLAFSPDGRFIASTSGAAVELYDAATGMTRGRFLSPRGPVWRFAFRPDGAILASAGADGTVRLWDVVTGTERHVLHGHTQDVLAVAFSPDGRLLVTGSGDHTLKLWEVASGRELLTLRGHSTGVRHVAFSPDGTRILSECGETIRLWEGGDLPAATRHARADLAVLLDLFDRHLLADDVTAVLRANVRLAPERRDALLRLARDWPPSSRLNSAALELISTAKRDPADYRQALRYAEVASEQPGFQGRYSGLLGAARYRLGEYAEARKILLPLQEEKYAKEHGMEATTLGFLAMSCHRLGLKAEAQAHLKRLRDDFGESLFAPESPNGQLLREVETLLSGKD